MLSEVSGNVLYDLVGAKLARTNVYRDAFDGKSGFVPDLELPGNVKEDPIPDGDNEAGFLSARNEQVGPNEPEPRVMPTNERLREMLPDMDISTRYFDLEDWLVEYIELLIDLLDRLLFQGSNNAVLQVHSLHDMLPHIRPIQDLRQLVVDSVLEGNIGILEKVSLVGTMVRKSGNADCAADVYIVPRKNM